MFQDLGEILLQFAKTCVKLHYGGKMLFVVVQPRQIQLARSAFADRHLREHDVIADFK
jgi:hypothetical protein